MIRKQFNGKSMPAIAIEWHTHEKHGKIAGYAKVIERRVGADNHLVTFDSNESLPVFFEQASAKLAAFMAERYYRDEGVHDGRK